LRAGAEGAGQAGELNAQWLISRPDPGLMACFGGAAAPVQREGGARALGLVETRSSVALIKAVDQMLKAADVEFEGNYKVGYFLTASAVRGDVGAVRVALEAARSEAVRHGELVAAYLIPQPFAELEERLPHR
jgi:microcompartment protein CcmL/EutN